MALVLARPSVKEERTEIATLRDLPLREGDTWYALSFRWWRQWCEYVDFDAAKTADQPGDPLEPNIASLSLDDAAAAGNGTPPGPIDNGDIAGAHNVELRENIIEDVDYVLLPAAAYLRLSQWYPSATATDPSFPRAVISTGQGNAKTERVELYPFCVPIARANEITGEPEQVEYKLFSREGAPTLKTIVDHYMKDIDTSDHKDETKAGILTLVTKHYQSKPLDVLELGVDEFICVEQWVRMDKEWPRAQFERPLTDVRLHDDLDALDAFSNWCEGTVIEIEKSESGDTNILVHFTGWASKYDEWYNLSQPDRVAKLARCGTHTSGAYIPKSERAGAVAIVEAATPSTTTTTAIGSTSYSSYYKNTSTSYSYGGGADYYASERGATAVKGAAGLRNLGNTCFMNSTLQCLSNTPLLTPFFLNDTYVDQINRDNPLGWSGKIADEWATVLKELWSGTYRIVAPRALKQAIGDFQPRFSGYQQQDSSELLLFLLDGLHEDLNRVLKKPATQPVESDGKPLEQVASESWDMHLMRNQSVIVDTCLGQLKSRLVCPKCERVSITFDPFMYFSVPLPTVKNKVVEVTVKFADAARAPRVYGVKVPKQGIVADVKKALAELAGVSVRRMCVVEIYQGRIFRSMADDIGVAELRSTDDVWVYELPGLEAEEAKPALERAIIATINQSVQRLNPAWFAGSYTKKYIVTPLGAPLLVLLPRSGHLVSGTNAVLRATVLDAIAPTLLPPPPPAADAPEVAVAAPAAPAAEDGGAADSDDIPPPPPPPPSSCSITTTTRQGYTCAKCDYYSRCDGCELPDNGDACALRLDLAFSVSWPDASRHAPAPTIERDESAPAAASESAYAGGSASYGAAREKSSVCALTDCFRAFSEEETLGESDAWYCRTCKEHVLATKKMDVWRCPDTLIIHLKRFQHTRYSREKLDTLVDFPLEGLDMAPWIGSAPNRENAVYDLYAISNHMGGMGGGHYTAYAKNLIDHQWYEFDDSRVSPVHNLDSMKGSEAYVLFYSRRQAPAAAADAAAAAAPDAAAAASAAEL